MTLSPDQRRLMHMRDYCILIGDTVRRLGESFDTFVADTDLQVSVVFHIMQIGKLCQGLSDVFKAETASVIPRVEMRAMRSKIVHGYGKLILEGVWQTAINDIPALRAFCDEQLRPYDEEIEERS